MISHSRSIRSDVQNKIRSNFAVLAKDVQQLNQHDIELVRSKKVDQVATNTACKRLWTSDDDISAELDEPLCPENCPIVDSFQGSILGRVCIDSLNSIDAKQMDKSRS